MMFTQHKNRPAITSYILSTGPHYLFAIVEEGGLDDLLVVDPCGVETAPAVDDVSAHLQQLQQAIGVPHQQAGAGGVPLQHRHRRPAAPHPADRTDGAAQVPQTGQS